MPRINRKPRRRVDPDQLPEDLTADLYQLDRHPTERLEQWQLAYPLANPLAMLFVHQELLRRRRTIQCQS